MEASGPNPQASAYPTSTDGAGGDEARWGALEATLPLLYVAELDRAGTLRYISDVVRDWTGYPPADFLGDSELWYRCIHRDDVGRVRDVEQRAFDTQEQLNLEYRLVGRDGEPRWVWERNTIVRDGRGFPICTHGTIVDLSRFGARQLDGVDADGHAALVMRQNFLTGLPTRQVLPEHLTLALARARRDGRTVALLNLDLDRFRGVNEAVGHSAGDIVLAQVASRLRCCVPEGDLLLHAGADEFLVMLEGLDTDAAEVAVMAVAGNISRVLAAPFVVNGRHIELRTSIGYALGPQDGGDADQLQRAAHRALAAAKQAGRAELLRYSADAADSIRGLSVDHRLRRAIERAEIKPYFQPIVDLASGEICAAEALVRWERSDGELLLPYQFVPTAEESSLIIDLDVHMIRSVCDAARCLQDSGHGLPVHVNVSPRIVAWHGFVRAVLQAIDASGIVPGDLLLEVTENVGVRDDAVSAALLELADLGVTIGMDDFGSAYSAVARLRMLPASVVKIDRAMLLAATGGLPAPERIGPASCTPEAGGITLSGVLAMGRALGITTVVEGVETAEARDLVREYGADMAQGYFFGRPAPFDGLIQRLGSADGTGSADGAGSADGLRPADRSPSA